MVKSRYFLFILFFVILAVSVLGQEPVPIAASEDDPGPQPVYFVDECIDRAEEQARQGCIYGATIRDVQECNSFQGETKDICMKFYAKQVGDATFCHGIVAPWHRLDCYRETPVETQHIEQCGSFTDAHRHDQCVEHYVGYSTNSISCVVYRSGEKLLECYKLGYASDYVQTSADINDMYIKYWEMAFFALLIIITILGCVILRAGLWRTIFYAITLPTLSMSMYVIHQDSLSRAFSNPIVLGFFTIPIMSIIWSFREKRWWIVIFAIVNFILIWYATILATFRMT